MNQKKTQQQNLKGRGQSAYEAQVQRVKSRDACAPLARRINDLYSSCECLAILPLANCTRHPRLLAPESPGETGSK